MLILISILILNMVFDLIQAEMFGVDNSSSPRTDNGKKDILIFDILSPNIQIR